MPDFRIRSTQKELLDRDDIPFGDIRQNMHELNTINTLLGGHSITIKGVKRLLKQKQQSPPLICEIGCGGGDNLHAISSYLQKENFPLEMIGIDIKKECVETAQQMYPNEQTVWIQSDYKKVQFAESADIIFSSLFCHHFTNVELVEQLQWMNKNSLKGFFINDLHRHPIAYYAILFITKLFSRSYLVKNDAPISVLRGFTKKEWQLLLDKAGIANYTIQWKWAFRHLIMVYK